MLTPLNAELNPICHLLALQGAHHILHVSRVRVKSLLREVWFLNHFSEKFGGYITSRIILLPKSLFGECWCLNHFSEKFGA